MARPPTILALVCSVLACSAGGPESHDPAGELDGGGVDDVEPGSVELVIDPLPERTIWPEHPLSGRGPSGGTVVVNSPAAGQQWASLGQSGHFCMDIPLSPGQRNVFTAWAIDAEGRQGDVITLDIAHDAASTADAGTPLGEDPQLRNAALDSASLEVFGDLLESSEAEAMIDGHLSSSALISDPPAQIGWVALELPEAAIVDHLMVYSSGDIAGADCPLEHFKVYLSDETLWPGPPSTGAVGNGWALVADVTEGQATQVVNPAVGSPMAVFVALEFLSKDCMPYVLYPGQHEIREIQVWVVADSDDGQSNHGGPSCASGGA